MTGKILIIDNDKELLQHLSTLLSTEGFEPYLAEDSETGLKLALNQSFALIILEVLLPHQNGFQVLKTLRKHQPTPVIFLSSSHSEVDRLLGIELGGDDYLTKPCSPQELLSRVRAIMRRTQTIYHQKARPQLQFDNLIIDCAQHQVTLNNQLLDITNTEFKILEILLKSPGQAFSKEELTEYTLNRKFTAYDRSIDVHISNLRQKLGLNKTNEPWIKTIRGFGYLFNYLPETVPTRTNEKTEEAML